MKELLHQHKVAFTDREITKDKTALADLEKIGVMTTPVIIVNGDAIVGYDIARLTSALGLSNRQ